MAAAVRAYAFGEFTVDMGASTLWRGDEIVPLPSRAFDALAYLLEHRDRLVPKDELVAAVWHDVVVTDDSLVHAVSVLRRALADDPHEPRYVQTVPRRGYRFIAEARVVGSPGAPPAAAAPQPGGAASAPNEAAPSPTPASRPRSPSRRWLVPACVAAGLALAALSLPRTPATDRARTSIRLFQPPAPGTTIVSGGVLSPDGRYLLFAARDDASGAKHLWLRTLSSSELVPVAGTDGASKPFWAPDSSRIGFFAAGKLMSVSLTGDAPRTLAQVGMTPAGGSWGTDDTILFASWANGLYTVPAAGGDAKLVLKLDREAEDIALAWPELLPDGRRFLYQVISFDRQRTGVHVGDLDTFETVRLLETGSPAVFAAPGYVLHVQNDMLIAEEIDLPKMQLTGRATLLARGIAPPSLTDDNVVSAAAGLLAFREGVKAQNLAWFDRGGAVSSTLPMPTVLYNPRLSPDETRLLATSSVTTYPGLWLASTERPEFERLETDAISPLWAPDGQRIAFTARGGYDLHVRDLTSPAASPVISGDSIKFLDDWSADGAEIVYSQHSEQSKLDLWKLDLAGRETAPLLVTPFNETQARISPDGRWLAYVSDEAGTSEVYVARYPEMDERRKASAGGGGQPQWRADQRELFYLGADRSLMTVAVKATEAGLELDEPRRLFRAPISGDPEDAREHYAVAANGTRFLVDSAITSADDSSITVVINWEPDAAPAHAERVYSELVSSLPSRAD